MFRFQHAGYLSALIAVPLLIALFMWVIYWRKATLKKTGELRLINAQMPGFIPGRSATKFILAVTALAMLVFAWANLQTGGTLQKVEGKGVEVVVALDVSKSMLANDIAPDRLTRAKQLILSLTEKFGNDKVAFIVFAGKAYLQVPLTIDYSALKMMVLNASPAMVPTQGTVIGDAIEMGMRCYSSGERKHKAMIIISDGEDHDEKAASVIAQAADAGIIVHTVGIGSPQGTTLIDPDTRTAKLDENGQPVVSKLNEEELKKLAAKGGGEYFYLQNESEVAGKLENRLRSMEQKNLGAVVYTDYTSFFQYFLGIALLLLVIEYFMPGARMAGKKTAKNTASSPAKLATVLLLLSVLLHGNTAMAQGNPFLRQGNSAYEQKKYDEAQKNYIKALSKDPNNVPSLFNLGNTLYQKKQYDTSRMVMSMTADKVKDKAGKSALNYNIGNTYMAERKWDNAVEAYKKALRDNPQDADAKYNLAYAKEMMKKEPPKSGGGKDNKENKDKENKDKNKDKQKGDDKKDEQQQNDPNGDQKDKDEQDKQPQPQPSKYNQQQAEQILNGLQQNEKKLQEKAKKEKAIPVKLDKDW